MAQPSLNYLFSKVRGILTSVRHQVLSLKRCVFVLKKGRWEAGRKMLLQSPQQEATDRQNMEDLLEITRKAKIQRGI